MKIPQLQFRPQDVRYVYLYDITDFKTATSQQKDALANTREDPYSKMSKELQTHLQCDDHPGKFCFKASNIRGVSQPSDHVQLDAVAIKDWATAILNDSATLTCPPRTPARCPPVTSMPSSSPLVAHT